MQIFLRIIKTAWYGFWRNGWLSLVAVFIMMQVLLLVGLFLNINTGVNTAIEKINERIDLAIFFQDYVPDSEILIFQSDIQRLDGIKSIQFISRDQALERYTASSQHDQGLLDMIGNDNSFFPTSLEIKLGNSNNIELVAQSIEKQDTNNIIAQTSLEKNKELINKLQKFNRLLIAGNLAVSSILLIIALLIIFNTIRITIFTRREELEIMKLVGATDWYIRWPFILEGVLYGIFGAILAFLLTLGAYQGLLLLLKNHYWSLQSLSSYIDFSNYFLLVRLFVFQLCFGVLVGSISSYLSTKRYLRI